MSKRKHGSGNRRLTNGPATRSALSFSVAEWRTLWTLNEILMTPAALSGAFLAAAVWGGQRGGQICIVGGEEFRMA